MFTQLTLDVSRREEEARVQAEKSAQIPPSDPAGGEEREKLAKKAEELSSAVDRLQDQLSHSKASIEAKEEQISQLEADLESKVSSNAELNEQLKSVSNHMV